MAPGGVSNGCRQAFLALRSPAGEQMILEDTLFIERRLALTTRY
jgi:hypothetical protein